MTLETMLQKIGPTHSGNTIANATENLQEESELSYKMGRKRPQENARPKQGTKKRKVSSASVDSMDTSSVELSPVQRSKKSSRKSTK